MTWVGAHQRLSQPTEGTPLLHPAQTEVVGARRRRRRRGAVAVASALLGVAALAAVSLVPGWSAGAGGGASLLAAKPPQRQQLQQKRGYTQQRQAGRQHTQLQTPQLRGSTGAQPSLTPDGVKEWLDSARGRLQAQEGGGATTQPPHIIFILADDLGWNDVGWAGDDLVGVTPTLDALRASGVELTSYYTQQLCTPARAALLSGRYPYKTGMQSRALGVTSTWGFPTEYRLLPQFLAGAGYTSHHVGKWHMGHAYDSLLPTSRGFATSFGLLGSSAWYGNHTSTDEDIRSSYTVTDFWNSWAAGGAHTEHQGLDAVVLDEAAGQGYSCVGDKHDTYSGTAFTERALTLADAWLEGESREPLFFLMSYQNPHGPRDPDGSADYSEVQDIVDGMTDANRANAAMVLYNLDQAVAQLVTGLQDRGMLDNAVVAFASDNGPCAGSSGLSTYPLRGSKNYTYEAGSHVRAFVTSPLLPESRVSTEYEGLFHVTDWVPTLMELALRGWSDSEHAAELDGVSQWSAIMDAAAEPPRTEVIYNLQAGSAEDEEAAGVHGAIRVGDWKYLHNEDCAVWYDVYGRLDALASECPSTFPNTTACGIEADPRSYLFNIREDPGETTDLSAEQPELVDTLRARLLEAAADMLPAISDVPDTVNYDVAGAEAAWDQAGCIGFWRRGNFDVSSYGQ